MGGLARKTKKKYKRWQKNNNNNNSSLPALPCPFSPSQKHRSIQTAPASSEFLLIPQCLCCSRLSWSPVNRATRDCAFCSFIFLHFGPSPPSPAPAQLPTQCCGNALAPCSASELLPLCSARPPREQPSGSSGGQTELVTLETKHRWFEHRHLVKEKPRAISLQGWEDQNPPCCHASGTPW